MSATRTSVPYMKDPSFNQALASFQRGEWEAGFEKLEKLEKSFPADQSLRAFHQEMQLRAKIDQDEKIDLEIERNRRIIRLGTRLSLMVLAVLLVFWGIRTYSFRVQQQLAQARARVEEEAREMELSIRFRNAQNLLQAGRAGEAIMIFQQIQEVDPEFPNLDAYLNQAQEAETVDARYNEALVLADQGEISKALGILDEIQKTAPNYRDVAQRMEDLKRDLLLEDLFEQAETAFETSSWQDAVSNYESVRSIDLSYRTDDVEDHLLQSYLNAAEEQLANPEGTLEALETANTYFRKALSLRPQNEVIIARQTQAREQIENRLVNTFISKAQEVLTSDSDSIETQKIAENYLSMALSFRPDDPEIQIQFDLSHKYLNGLDSFNKGLMNDAIDDLAFIYQNDRNYASGTARQTLYDAYVARGNSEMAVGDYKSALIDFQDAAMIAGQPPVSALRLYEAQLKVAYTQGLLLNYEDAVLIYRSAVDFGDLSTRALENSTLSNSLAEAENYAVRGNYRQAYLRYREVLRNSNELYDYTVHIVQENEYLTMIARRYNSTVEAIAIANEISNPNKIFVGQELLVPTLPGSDDQG